MCPRPASFRVKPTKPHPERQPYPRPSPTENQREAGKGLELIREPKDVTGYGGQEISRPGMYYLPLLDVWRDFEKDTAAAGKEKVEAATGKEKIWKLRMHLKVKEAKEPVGLDISWPFDFLKSS